MEIEEAVRCALEGNAILFVGAGVSFLSIATSGSKVPNGRLLRNLLLGKPPSEVVEHPLERVAASAIKRAGAEHVYDTLRQNLTVRSVDARLEALYRLPWKRIYTTNYDDAIEVSLRGMRRSPISALKGRPVEATRGSIIHLNGYIRSLAPFSLATDMVLTDYSYALDNLSRSGWLSFLENDLRTTRVAVFVGYSLSDLDIARVIIHSEFTFGRSFFFIDPSADAVEIDSMNQYGSVVAGGVDRLFDTIDEERKHYVAPELPVSFTALRELAAGEFASDQTSAAEVISRQLVFGILPEERVLSGAVAFSQQGFVVVREQERHLREKILLGGVRDVLFLGEIASGKTAASLSLSAFFISQGYRVFVASRNSALREDLDSIASFDGRVAILFDGYSPFRDDIEYYASKRNAQHRIIMTERLGIHEFIGDFVVATPGIGPIEIVNLDKISSVDLDAFERLVDFGGFWGDRSGASPVSRQKFIEKSLDGSLYRLLLEIVKSTKVYNMIKDLVRPIYAEEKIAKVFCSALIVNSVGGEFTVSEWAYLFERRTIERLMKTYADQTRHFFFGDYDHVFVRYGMLSTYILHAFTDSALIVSCLVDVFSVAERNSRGSDKWRTICVELMKFSNIERMVAAEGAKQAIFSYYDQIRVYGGTVRNPDYWLQNGIAATVFDDLQRGQICFDNAYARERAHANPNLKKIDNYFSRFQMRKAISEKNRDVAFEMFCEASDRLKVQIFLDNNRHYPFKTGRYFAEVAAKHFSSWSVQQQEIFLANAREVRQKAIEWKEGRKESNPDVEILIKEVTQLLGKLTSQDGNQIDGDKLAKK